VVKQHEGKEIHVILVNPRTHKPKRDMLLARHRNVHFHGAHPTLEGDLDTAYISAFSALAPDHRSANLPDRTLRIRGRLPLIWIYRSEE
jgi:hypothetical protein